MTIKIRGDEWPASALDGWGVVVQVDAANQVTVSVAGLDRVVAVGLLREAADALEAGPDEAKATYEPLRAEADEATPPHIARLLAEGLGPRPPGLPPRP